MAHCVTAVLVERVLVELLLANVDCPNAEGSKRRSAVAAGRRSLAPRFGKLFRGRHLPNSHIVVDVFIAQHIVWPRDYSMCRLIFSYPLRSRLINRSK